MVELTAFAAQYAESMAQSTGLMVCITDRDQIIAVSGGPKKDLLQKNISKQLEHAINDRETIVATKDEKPFVQIASEEVEGMTAQVITPIICEGDANRGRGAAQPGTPGEVWGNGSKAGQHRSRIFGTADGRVAGIS